MTQSTDLTIVLNEDDMISEGAGRIVYHHPARAGWLIKVHKPLRKKNAVRRLRFMRRRYGALMNSMYDAEEWTAMVARGDILPDFIPAYGGLVATSKGIGAVFQSVTGAEGALAPTLHAKISRDGFGPELAAAVDALWDKIEATRCIVSDPHLQNVLVEARAEGPHLWLVDGLGERTLIPIRTWSDRAFTHSARKMRNEMMVAAQQLASHQS